MPDVIAKLFLPLQTQTRSLWPLSHLGLIELREGLWPELKLEDYPNNFTNFLETRCLAMRGPHSSVATSDWKLSGHYPLTQGTGRLRLGHSLMPLTTHLPKSLLLRLASDTISQYTSGATGTELEKLREPAEGHWESLPPAPGVLIPTRVFVPQPSLSHGFKPASLHRGEK